jgi:hypothetical protein
VSLWSAFATLLRVALVFGGGEAGRGENGDGDVGAADPSMIGNSSPAAHSNVYFRFELRSSPCVIPGRPA